MICKSTLANMFLNNSGKSEKTQKNLKNETNLEKKRTVNMCQKGLICLPDLIRANVSAKYWGYKCNPFYPHSTGRPQGKKNFSLVLHKSLSSRKEEKISNNGARASMKFCVPTILSFPTHFSLQQISLEFVLNTGQHL